MLLNLIFDLLELLAIAVIGGVFIIVAAIVIAITYVIVKSICEVSFLKNNNNDLRKK